MYIVQQAEGTMTTRAVHISALDSTDDNKSNTWDAFSHCWKHHYGLC